MCICFKSVLKDKDVLDRSVHYAISLIRKHAHLALTLTLQSTYHLANSHGSRSSSPLLFCSLSSFSWILTACFISSSYILSPVPHPHCQLPAPHALQSSSMSAIMHLRPWVSQFTQPFSRLTVYKASASSHYTQYVIPDSLLRYPEVPGSRYTPSPGPAPSACAAHYNSHDAAPPPPGFRCCAVSGADRNPESGSDPALHIPQAGKAPGPCSPQPHRAPLAAVRGPRLARARPPAAPPTPAPVRPPRRLFFVTVAAAGAVGDRSQNPAGFRSRSGIALRPPGSAAAGLASALSAQPGFRAPGPCQLPAARSAHANRRSAAHSRAGRPPPRHGLRRCAPVFPGPAATARPCVVPGSGPYSPFPATQPPYPVFGHSPGRGLGLQPLWRLRKSEAVPWLPGPGALLVSTFWWPRDHSAKTGWRHVPAYYRGRGWTGGGQGQVEPACSRGEF